MSELDRAKGKSEQEAFDQAFGHISNALYRYVGDRFNLPTAGLTSARLLELLEEHGVDDTAKAAIDQCLKACDLARFAPTTLSVDHTLAILDSAIWAIDAIEQQITEKR